MTISYLIRVGNSSRNTNVVAKLQLDEDTIVEKLKNIDDQPDFKDFVPDREPFSYKNETNEIINAPIIQLKRDDFKAVLPKNDQLKFAESNNNEKILWSVVVNNQKSLLQFVNTLNDKELVTLLTGNYDEANKGGASVVGNAASTVAGAAGETTHKLKQLGVPSLVMADGPAGLRLSTSYTLDEKGNAHALKSQFAGMPGTSANQEKSSKDSTKFYQYCTAIPIGTAIAQSWNVQVATIYGDLVGSEMEQFGINLWLAPALNIQRSPLNGRNFEYYSEDPLISGLNAAQITIGVQKHPGCTTTIKHFAANNQETNRIFSNSVLSNRALRQIYLKGFEIAIKKGQPLAIMTAYNLVNGTHISGRRDVLTDIVRNEWKFDGFIMTDWLATNQSMPNVPDGKYSAELPVQNVFAGNDVMMPGIKADTDAILKALDNGELKRVDVKMAAYHVLNVILKLTANKE